MIIELADDLTISELDEFYKNNKHFLKNGVIQMNKEKAFQQFLYQYLENVKRELPESYRAQQLKEGGSMADAVYRFETRFLKDPFMRAIENDTKRTRE